MDGAIEGDGLGIRILHPKETVDYDNAPVRDESYFILTGEYKPANGVDHTDCLRIRGNGTISGVYMDMIALGNVCVELKEIGAINVGGSIKEATNELQEKNITTDFIFRNDVVVNGEIGLYHDSRVVFEKTATIKGDVVLGSGDVPNTEEYLGRVRGTSVRKGVQDGTAGKFKCEYVTKRGDDRMRAAHIPGIQFEDAVTIEGNLDVRPHDLAGTAVSTDDETNNTECIPRVLFMVPEAKTTGSTWIAKTSKVGGNLLVRGADRVYLDYDSLTTSKVKRETTHSLHVGGGIHASGTTIGMGHPKIFSNTGMCRTTNVTPGNEIVLTGEGQHIIFGDAELGIVSTEGPLEVQNGPLRVKHLHVRAGGELKADNNVVVSEGLILEGDGLSGTLSDASTIKTLVYGSRDTDLVNSAAMVNLLEALSVAVGDEGELGLDQVTKTKNLGLCSGTLVLREAGTDTDSTLTVHDQITVQNGFLTKDTNRLGSIATDKAASPSEADRYILKYITPGKRTVTDALEWFDPRDVIVDHKSADISVTGARSLMGKLTVTNGKLTVDGDLTVGTSPLHRTGSAARTNAGKYSLLLSNASELHTKEDNVVVNGGITLNGTSKLMTDGGDVHMLGRVDKGKYDQSIA